jgi:glycosyltransferase involved in cell wall biosynthesis
MVKEKKILFYTYNISGGGGNKYIVDLVKFYKNQNYNCTILINKNGLKKEDFPDILNTVSIDYINTHVYNNIYNIYSSKYLTKLLRIIFYFISPIFFITNVFRLNRYLVNKKFDLIYSCNGGYPAAESTISLLLLARLKKIKIVYTITSTPQKRRFYFYFYDIFLDYILNKTAQIIIVNSSHQRNVLNNLRNISLMKIHILYNSLSPIDIKSIVLKEQVKTIAYIGRLDKLKGIEYLIEAISNLTFANKIEVQIIGEGEYKDNLESKINSLNLNHCIKLTGYLDIHVDQIMKNIDILVFPSLWEGLPYTIIEGIRSGVPIVSTNVGGIPEIIFDMHNGILVKPKCSESLSNAIELLYNNYNLRSKFSINSIDIFNKKFTSDILEKKLISITNQLNHI